MSFYSEMAEYYEAIFPYRDEVYAFLQSTGAGARRILDLGCGTGHYCGRFARDGCEAIGIDLDPAMIATAQREYPRARFACLDMRDSGTFPPGFDLIYCIGNSLPHVTQADLDGLLASIVRLLRPGGAWVFQIVNYDPLFSRTAYTFPPRPLKGGTATFYREYRDISASHLRFLTRLVAGEKVVFEGEVTLYPMRSAEYVAAHARHGFELVEHVADFDRRPFDPAGSGSVFVFRMPQAN